MEEITADDDLLSCMLVDSLEFEPDIVTHKMNAAFRPMRFDRHAVTKIIQQHVIWEQDVSKGIKKFCEYVSIDSYHSDFPLFASTCAQKRQLKNEYLKSTLSFLLMTVTSIGTCRRIYPMPGLSTSSRTGFAQLAWSASKR